MYRIPNLTVEQRALPRATAARGPSHVSLWIQSDARTGLMTGVAAIGT